MFAKDMHVCTYCGKNGHLIDACWTKQKHDKSNQSHVQKVQSPRGYTQNWSKTRKHDKTIRANVKQIWVRKDRSKPVSKGKEPKKIRVPKTKP